MTDIEASARRMGWRPEKEFDETATKNRRRPSRFLTAEEYVAKCDNDLPVLRERNRFLDGELAAARIRIEELDGLVLTLHERNKAASARLREEERRRFAAEVGRDGELTPTPVINGHVEAYDGLGNDEKEDCDRFLRCIPGLTVADYIDMYCPR